MRNARDIESADSKSSLLMDDDNMLLHALDSVGTSAYGIVCISAWILNEGSSHLIQQCFWVDPIFRRENKSDSLEMLLDERRMDYSPARPLIPGEGLEGVLFSECINTIRVRTSHIKRSSILRMIQPDKEIASVSLPYSPRGFQFRLLRHILEDDDQPYNRRLSLLVEAKIGKAIGLPFHHNLVRGIVVYMTRENAREEDLLSDDCIRYLLSSTQYISGLFIFLMNRRVAQMQIQERLNGSYTRIRRKLLAIDHMKKFPGVYKKMINNHEGSPTTKERKRILFQYDCMRSIMDRIQAWFQKCKGGNGAYICVCVFMV